MQCPSDSSAQGEWEALGVGVWVDITPSGRRIRVDFAYQRDWVESIKKVQGSSFTPPTKGGPFWTVPLDTYACRELRDRFGPALNIGPALKRWAKERFARERKLAEIAAARDYQLTRLPAVLPALHNTLRDYQRVGIAFGATCPNPLFADDTRLGKTLQSIGSIFESGMDEGAHLVISPVSALETTWQRELWKWQDYPTWIAQGPKRDRDATLAEFAEYIESGEPGWLIVNPAMVAYRSGFDVCKNHMIDDPIRERRACDYCEEYHYSEFPLLQSLKWNSMIVDECGRNGVRNTDSMTHAGMADVKARKKMALAARGGMGGRELNLWGILHFLEPEDFSAKWTFVGRWIEVDDTGYGKKIGRLKPERKEDFYRTLSPYMIQRFKKDVRPELPDEDEETLHLTLAGEHQAQYKKFAEDAEIRIDEEKLTATSILAEYVRLKQFASFPHKLKGGVLIPQPDGAKMDAIWDLLDERGILEGADANVVIFSQFSQVVDMLAQTIGKKVPTDKITGSVKSRAQIQDAFQAGTTKVLVMTTTAGGYAITLDRADTALFTDRTWDPDDQYQARSRMSPVTFLTPKTALYLEARGTIEEYIRDINFEKDDVTLDLLKGIRLS